MAPKPFKNFPSPNSQSDLSNRLKRLGRSPSTIAALASLGAHGLVFGLLPFWPDSATRATEAEIRNPVEVVELTPAEQSRLPQMVTLPPVELPPLLPPTASSDLFKSPGLPKPPTSSTLPRSDSLLAPPPPLPIFIPPVAPPPMPTFTLRLPSAPPIAIQPAPISPAPAAPSSPSPAPSSPSPAASSPSPSVAVEPSPEGAENAPGESGDQVATAPSPSPRTQADIQQDLLARQQELRELYTYNAAGTSVADANTSFLSWYSEAMGKDYAEGEARPEQQVVKTEYPKLACPLKQSRNAVVGVVVDAENRVVGEPAILQSSGYRLFNQEALNVAKAYNFENETGSQQVYLLRINFDYSEEVCPPGLEPLAPAS
ncbi:MAG: hypothetical protein ACKO7W_24805 [Elainella sp.]